MPIAIIYYFSGTNNTQIASQMIKTELDRRGYATDLYQIKKPLKAVPDPAQYDIIGMGYPVHAFNPPQLFLSTIRKIIPRAFGKPAFIFKTAGEPFPLNNASSWSIIRILRRRGYRVLMDRHLLMPYNILFHYPLPLAKQMYFHTQKLAEVIASHIQSETVTIKRVFPLTWLVMISMRLIIHIGARFNGPFFHVKKDRCLQCGHCQKICPSNNIRFRNGYPSFSVDCSMCMGCVMYCPTDAIRPGLVSWLRVAGAYPFGELAKDDMVESEYVNDQTKGYFRNFRSYYRKTQLLIDEVDTKSQGEK